MWWSRDANSGFLAPEVVLATGIVFLLSKESAWASWQYIHPVVIWLRLLKKKKKNF